MNLIKKSEDADIHRNYHSLHHIKTLSSETLAIYSQLKTDFDAKLYSKFKYGFDTEAFKYAEQLARLFLLKKLLIKGEKYFLSGSAYQNVPTAAEAIAKHLCKILTKQGYIVTYFKINGKSFSKDYSEMSSSARSQILSNIPLSLNKDIVKKIGANKVFIIDDIRITGLHEQAIDKFLSDLGIRNVIHGYVATLDPKDGLKFPRIEWQLNHQCVNSLEKLREIVCSNNFALNARVCKFILAASSKDVIAFAKSIPSVKLQYLLSIMAKDRYHEMPEYKDNFLLMKTLLDRSKIAEKSVLENN